MDQIVELKGMRGRRRVCAILTVGLFVASLLPAQRSIFDRFAPYRPPLYPELAADMLRALGEYRTGVIRQNAAIQSARKAYFRLYPDRPGVADAANTYHKCLFTKDIFYLLQVVQTGEPDPQWRMFNTVAGLDIQAGAPLELDGGVPIAARPAFRKWVAALRSRLSLKDREYLPFSIGTIRTLQDALVNPPHEYWEYVSIRDLEELRIAGLQPIMLSESEWLPLAASAEAFTTEASSIRNVHDPESGAMPGYSWNDPYEGASKIYAEAMRLFGQEHVLSAMKVVLSSPRPIQAPSELGDFKDSLIEQALMNHWAAGSPKAFILGQLRQSSEKESFGNFAHAEIRYRAFVEDVGESRMLEISELLRKAPKKVFHGSEGVNYSLLADPQAAGCTSEYIDLCLHQLLPGAGLLDQRKKGSARGARTVTGVRRTATARTPPANTFGTADSSVTVRTANAPPRPQSDATSAPVSPNVSERASRTPPSVATARTPNGPPGPLADTPTPRRSGRLEYGGPPVPQNGEIEFFGLPSGRLRLQYDEKVWSCRVTQENNGTQRIVLQSVKKGLQQRAVVLWALE